MVAKQPAAGLTKTRLCPPLHGEEAATLYASFLADTLEIMRCVPDVRRGIAYLPKGAEAYFSDLAPELELVLQQGESLGERLDQLITDALRDGAAQAVVMDSDSPTLRSYVPAATQSTAVPPGRNHPSGHRQKRTWCRLDGLPATCCW